MGIFLETIIDPLFLSICEMRVLSTSGPCLKVRGGEGEGRRRTRLLLTGGELNLLLQNISRPRIAKLPVN